jgi:hypothetical protein
VTRDEALKKFLAESIMGWTWIEGDTLLMYPSRWGTENGVAYYPDTWDPAESWGDIGVVLDAVKEDEQGSRAIANLLMDRVRNDGVWSILSPCILSEIVATAYGWKEETS